MDLFEPGPGSQRVHDYTGGIDGLFWTVRLADESVVVSHKGKRLTVDARDVPVVDTNAQSPVPVAGTVSFQMTWKARGARRRLGRRNAPAGDPADFLGKIFVRSRATGVFSGTTGLSTFQSDATNLARSTFAELGTEKNGTMLHAATARCLACGALPAPGW